MTRTHDRQFFYKYTDFNGLKLILENSSLKWSSPIIFNDPFDHQLRFKYIFEPELAIRAFEEACKRLVYDDSIILVKPTIWSKIATVTKQFRDKFDERAFITHMRPGIEESVSRFPQLIKQVNELILSNLINSRMLCVSEHFDNLLMWSHYADQHRGGVLRIDCIDEVDNALLVAEKVVYQEAFLEFPDIDTFIRHQTGESELDIPAMMAKMAYIKHVGWQHEAEWRVFYPFIHEVTEKKFSIWPENRKVFAVLYLGCMMPESEQNILLTMVENLMPHMTVYKAKMMEDHFGLNFVKL